MSPFVNSHPTAPPGANTCQKVVQARHWQAPRWLNIKVLLACWIMALIYGSLLPFDFTISLGEHGVDIWRLLGAVLTSPCQWVLPLPGRSSLGIPLWLGDLMINIVLYVPLGILLRLYFHRLGSSRMVAMIYIALFIMALSWLVESLQSLTLSRYPSLNDFIANSVTAVLCAATTLRLRELWLKVIFYIYCRSAPSIHRLLGYLRELRQRPTVMLGFVMFNITLLTMWYLPTYLKANNQLTGHGLLLPFEEQFYWPYDVAALYIGRSMLIYCLIASLLSLQFFRPRQRRGLGLVILLSTLLAAGEQLLHGQIRNLNITEPVIAIVAVGLIVTSAFLSVHAVRCSCRRRRQVDIEHDRRNRPHDYSFGIH